MFMLFLPRRWRIACFFIVTAWQIPVILTANYTFLNYLVLVLGFLLLDDRFCLRFAAGWWKRLCAPESKVTPAPASDLRSSRTDETTPPHAPERIPAARAAILLPHSSWRSPVSRCCGSSTRQRYS